MPKRGSPSPQLEGPRKSVPQLEGPRPSAEVHHPNPRGHTKEWDSITPTRGATQKHGSPLAQRFRAEDKINSRPQVGRFTAYTLSSGSPTL